MPQRRRQRDAVRRPQPEEHPLLLPLLRGEGQGGEVVAGFPKMRAARARDVGVRVTDDRKALSVQVAVRRRTEGVILPAGPVVQVVPRGITGLRKIADFIVRIAPSAQQRADARVQFAGLLVAGRGYAAGLQRARQRRARLVGKLVGGNVL